MYSKFSFTKHLDLSQIQACSHMVKQVLELNYAVLEFRDLEIFVSLGLRVLEGTLLCQIIHTSYSTTALVAFVLIFKGLLQMTSGLHII